KGVIILNGWIICLLLTSFASGYDGSLMNSLFSLDTFKNYFYQPTGAMMGIFVASQSIGALVGLPFAPYLSDMAGRRKAIFIGAVIMTVGIAIQTGSQNVLMFLLARYFINKDLKSFATNAAPLLISEIAYPTHRAPLISLYSPIGCVQAAWSAFGTSSMENSWSWRIPSALQSIGAIVPLLTVWFVPESPRWLISQGRNGEAREILTYWHGNSDSQEVVVELEFAEIIANIEVTRNITSSVGYISMFTTPANRKRTVLIIALGLFCQQWTGNGLIATYLHSVLNVIGIGKPATQLFISALLQMWYLTWAVGAGLSCDLAGRRNLFLTSCLGMLLFFVVQTVCSAQFDATQSKAAAYAVVSFIFLFFAAYAIAFSPLVVSYCVEILPYSLRAKGLNILFLTVGIAVISNQFVNPIVLKAIGWKYYLVYDCWICFEVVFCYFYIVETKNRTLEETAACVILLRCALVMLI
ncbi:general substrate transporter, partial [Hysterangium stoloniferum]